MSETRVLWLLGIAAVSGCQKSPAPSDSYVVAVRAVDESGKAVPGLQLSAAGANLAISDAQGRASFALKGVEGQRMDLAATCPDRYTGPRERPAFLLQHARDADGNVRDKPIELSLTCDAKDHYALVAVQTGQAGLPIMSHGQVLGQTSELGTAHVMLREPTGKTFQLTLDTSAKPELRPENPTRTFTVTQKDSFSVWDQAFEAEKKASAAESRKKRKMRGAAAGGAKRKGSRAR